MKHTMTYIIFIVSVIFISGFLFGYSFWSMENVTDEEMVETMGDRRYYERTEDIIKMAGERAEQRAVRTTYHLLVSNGTSNGTCWIGVTGVDRPMLENIKCS